MFGAFYFGQGYFADAPFVGITPPVPPKPAVGALGGGGRGRRAFDPHLVRTRKQLEADQRQYAQRVSELKAQNASDEHDLRLICAAWLKLK